jgi:hypothetical protein
MFMKIGDLIEYINLDGDPIYGVICKDVHKSKDAGMPSRENYDAVKVVWTDDNSVTTEYVEDILDPGYTGLVLL